jgi:allantoin racemase
MKIMLINPNTTQYMTDSILKCAQKYASPGTELYAVTASFGVSSVECYVDEYLAAPAVLREVMRGEGMGMDAYLICCFGDPALQAARELTEKPVLGIAESAIAAAKMIAPYFSVVSVLDRSVKVTADVVNAYGAAPFCRSIRSTGLSVLDFGKDPKRGLAALAEQSRLAVAEDKAECVLLGCAGFVDFVEELQRELGVPVLDGVSPAVRFAEALAGLGLKTSKVRTWMSPEKKTYTGYRFPDMNQNENEEELR